MRLYILVFGYNYGYIDWGLDIFGIIYWDGDIFGIIYSSVYVYGVILNGERMFLGLYRLGREWCWRYVFGDY